MDFCDVIYNAFLAIVLAACICLVGQKLEDTANKNHAEVIRLIKNQTNVSAYNNKAEVEFFRSLKKAGEARNTKEKIRGN